MAILGRWECRRPKDSEKDCCRACWIMTSCDVLQGARTDSYLCRAAKRIFAVGDFTSFGVSRIKCCPGAIKERAMNLVKAGCAVVAALALSVSLSAQGAKHPIAFEDMMKLHRVSAPPVSADGKWAAFVVSTPDMESNRNASNVWIVSTAGGEAMQLTQSGHDSSPAWSPDGKTLAFLSSRDGNSQVYILSMEGGEAHAVTHLSTGADLVKWSPDGKTIAFTSSVYPDCKDDACNKKRDEEKEKNKVKARVYEQLLYRHWDHWYEGKRSHLFVEPADGGGEARDLNAGANYDVPPDQRGGPDRSEEHSSE